MNLEYTDTNQWSAILPEIILVVLALSLLLVDMFGGKRGKDLVGRVAVFGKLILLGLGFSVLRDNLGVLDQETFSGMLYHSEFGQVMRLFFLVSSTVEPSKTCASASSGAQITTPLREWCNSLVCGDGYPKMISR